MSDTRYTNSEIADMLDQTILAKVLSWKELLAFAEYLDSISIEPGTCIFNEGDVAEEMYILIRGKLNVFKRDSLGVNKMITRISPGRTVGEMGLLDGEPRSASVCSANESVLFCLHKYDFELILSDRPRMGVKLMQYITKLICSRLRHTSGALVEFLSKKDMAQNR